MTALDVRVGSARGELQRPWESRSGSWSSREVITLQLRDAEGRVGRGEASPLPGFSREDYACARGELEHLDWARAYEERHEVVSKAGWGRSGEGVIGRLCPSARFAAELAIEELLAQSFEAPHPYLSPAAGPPMLTAPVVPVNDEAWFAAAAEEAVRDGARTIKMKVGRNWPLESWALRHLRETFGPSLRIRLDANGALADSPQEVRRRLEDVARVGVEFIEEPCPLDALSGLDSPVPIALDESLVAVGVEGWPELLDRPEVAYWVLKPMLLGGMGLVHELAGRARAAGRGVVISHLLDGPVAYRAYARLARHIGGPTAMGLAPHPGLLALGEGAPRWARGYALSAPDSGSGRAG